MAALVRTPLVYCEFQYAGETDEQHRRRCARIRAEHLMADTIEKAWAPAPMKGLRAGWDCGCYWSCTFRGGEQHPFCPRRE